VLGAGTKAVLKALDQGLALVLGKKGGTSGFQSQQTDWNRLKNNYTKGESEFINSATKASDQFLSGVFSGGDPTADLIQLLRLISGYQQKVSNAAANWDQAPNKTGYDIQVQSKLAADPTGAAAGKQTVSSGLKGATQLTQTVAKAEVTLYEKVAIAEIEYEGGILNGQEAVTQIDAAFAEFEKTITGGARTMVKGAPVGWNTAVNQKVTPTTTTWNVMVNMTSATVLSTTPPDVTTPTVTTTTTVTQPQTAPTVTIQCPMATQQNDYGWQTGDVMTVTGSVSPAVSGGSVTISYGSSFPDASTTHTVTTGAGGSFSDSFTITDTRQQAISIQATHAGSPSNACPEESYGG